MRYLFTISYDGSNYAGFQRQENANSIQTEIEKALKRMTRKEITINSAGRTDKGVHALGQTFHIDLDFEIDINKWIEALNLRLPDDIIVLKIKAVSNKFHARHSAKERVYVYKIAKNPSTILTQRYELYVNNFNLELARETSKLFIGTKDFTGFYKSSSKKDPVRTIKKIDIKETKDHYYFTFYGVSFLRYMVRSIMGQIISVATNQITIDDVKKIFETKERRLASKTAEAKALYLKRIIY